MKASYAQLREPYRNTLDGPKYPGYTRYTVRGTNADGSYTTYIWIKVDPA